MGSLRLNREKAPPIEFTLDRTLVGREATCDVVVDDKSVSRKHAYIERRGGGWAVVDQGSANGTFVNGQRVAEAELRDGQELRLGMVNFRVEIESELPGTVLMAAPELDEPPATVLMPNPELAPPAPRAPTPPPAAPRASAPPSGPRAAAPPPVPSAPPRAAAPPPAAPSPAARTRNAEEEAAGVLGVAVGASPYEVKERYEELSRDLQLKLANARTPVLKGTYEKNLAALRKAYHVLSPAAALSPDSVADLPSAQPMVGPDFLEGSGVLKKPVVEAPLPEAAHAKGASVLPPATSFFVLTATALLAAFAFFSLSASKLTTQVKKEEESQGLVTAREAAAKYETAALLQKNGALRNGKVKLCNRSSRPLDVAWLSAVYVEKEDLGENADSKLAQEASGYKLVTYNSAFCPREYKLVVPPGAEQAVELKSQERRCSWDGSALFYSFAVQRPEEPAAPSEAPVKAGKGGGRKAAGAPGEAEKKPGEPGTMVWFSGLLNGRQECIPLGAGW